MTNQEAKQILLIYRPGTVDERDPEVVKALAFAQAEPALQPWLREHCEFQNAIRSKFREVPVPLGLRDAIMARRKVIRPTIWWRSRVALAAAASIVILVSIAGFWNQSKSGEFANFRSRMVGSALREYRMDVKSKDMEVVRQVLASKGSPTDYQITSGLAKLQVVGGGALSWKSKPVSMVCFHNGTNMLYLFVMNRTAVKDAPQVVQTESVRGLTTLSWTEGNNSYVLAGPDEPGFAQKYL